MDSIFWSDNIGYFVLASMVLVCIVLGVIFYQFFKIDLKDMAKQRYMSIREKQIYKAKSSHDKRVAYDTLDDFLLSRGVKYRMGDNFTPFDYEVLRVFVSVLLGLLMMIVHPLFVIVGFLVGWFGVPYYFKHEDENDSKEMLPDVAQMYGIVSLQVRNGVFLSKIIYECFIACGNPRLKKALNELSIEIDRFSDIKLAVRHFRVKFNDKYIDIFSRALEQAQETGKAKELFEDIEKQIATINEAMAIRREKNIKSLCSAFEMLVFIGAILVVCYIVFTTGKDSVSGFF